MNIRAGLLTTTKIAMATSIILLAAAPLANSQESQEQLDPSPAAAEPAESEPDEATEDIPASLSTEAQQSSESVEQSSDPVPTTAAPDPTRHALIVCGHPGDSEHRELYAQSIHDISEGLQTWLSFPQDNIRILFGSEVDTSQDNASVSRAEGLGTAEDIERIVSEYRKGLTESDRLWVVVLGHAHFDGQHVWLNLVDKDLNEIDFAKSFADLNCGEQVFWLTTPASGFQIKSLAAPGRVVISATQADLEVNETIFHRLFAELLSDPESTAKDIDADGHISLFDMYLSLTEQIAQSYLDEELLATEHALIDDNHDGRGSESQMYYLSEELGGRAGLPVPTRQKSLDGKLANTMILAKAPEPVVQATEETTENKDTESAAGSETEEGDDEDAESPDPPNEDDDQAEEDGEEAVEPESETTAESDDAAAEASGDTEADASSSANSS